MVNKDLVFSLRRFSSAFDAYHELFNYVDLDLGVRVIPCSAAGTVSAPRVPEWVENSTFKACASRVRMPGRPKCAEQPTLLITAIRSRLLSGSSMPRFCTMVSISCILAIWEQLT